MGKRSQRRPKRNEKDHPGCMWGIISMFDFRHGRQNHKLITDGRQSSKHAVGERSIVLSKNKFEMLSNLGEDCEGNFDGGESKRMMVATDVVKPCVKKLIEEEMLINQDMMKNVHDVEAESKESRLRLLNPLKIDSSKRKKKSRKKSRDIDTDSLKSDSTLESELIHDDQHSRQQSRSCLDLENILEGLSHFKDSCSVGQPNEKDGMAENNVRDAIFEFVNHIVSNGKDLSEDENFVCPQELMKVVEVVSSDKELLLRLLQDPNSFLRKHVQEFNISKQEPSNLRQQTTEVVSHKQRNVFWKKVMPQAKSPTKGNDNIGSSKRIVIYKPYSETDNNLASSLGSHDMNHHPKSSHFSFTELKKKLKHAMGKERHGNSNPRGSFKKLSVECQNAEKGSKVFGKDSNGMLSPNKDHFFIEKIAKPTSDTKKGDKAGKFRDFEVTSDRCFRQRDSNLYSEAKKHLHEILGNGDESMEFSSRRVPETLGRILSLPEYNFSPIGSPRREHDHHFVTSHTRFSTTENIQEANEDFQQDPATNNLEKQTCICGESSHEKVQDSINLKLNLPTDLTHVDRVEEIVPEDSMAREDQECDSEISDGSRPCLCLNQEISEENQPLFSSPSSSSSSSHSSITRKVAEMEGGSDEFERPSPVSVLDAPFDISPGNIKSEPDKDPVKPLHIQFEDHDSSPMDHQIEGRKLCTEENKLIFDYIESILQSSGLDRDQLRIKYLSSNQLLDQSSFDESPNQIFHHDMKLIFDCINEVLVDVCWHYFGILPWATFLKPSKIRPNPDMNKVVLMIWQRVCWHLLSFPRPHTLDQIVQKDMAGNETWMDLRGDAESVIVDMGEAILAELMEDTVFSCVSEDLEGANSQLESKLQED